MDIIDDFIYPERKWEELLGYKRRNPFESELMYFKSNPNVAGMGTEDKKIILNPFAGLSPQQYQVVANNEALRLAMGDLKLTPAFKVTPDQYRLFANTSYAQNEAALKNTIIARYLTGDPSSGSITKEQGDYASWLMDYLFKR